MDAFDLDPRMVARARNRLRERHHPVCVWVGDATAIAARDASYDAVFDFGIIHHIPDWRRTIAEIFRVLKPGGRFYAEEVLRKAILHPVVRNILRHPQTDRFDSAEFLDEMRNAGRTPLASRDIWGYFAWFVASKPAQPSTI